MLISAVERNYGISRSKVKVIDRNHLAVDLLTERLRLPTLAQCANLGGVEAQLSLLIFFAGRHVPLSARARKIMQESRS